MKETLFQGKKYKHWDSACSIARDPIRNRWTWGKTGWGGKRGRDRGTEGQRNRGTEEQRRRDSWGERELAHPTDLHTHR